MSMVLCVRMVLVSAVLFFVFFAEATYRFFTLRATTSVLTFVAMLFWFVERRGGVDTKFWPRDLVRLDFGGGGGATEAIEGAKKVDENGNALHQNTATKGKKKKVQAEKNVMTSYSAEKLVGHRGDIINDVDKLVEFIGEDVDKGRGGRQKQLHKNAADATKGGKKQRGGGAAQTSKSNKEAGRNELKKSNSLEEVSTTKLDGFKFDESGKDAKQRRAKEEGDNKAAPKSKIDPVADTPRARIEAEPPKATPKPKPEADGETKATPKSETVIKTTPKAKAEPEATPRVKTETDSVSKGTASKPKQEVEVRVTSKGKNEAEAETKVTPRSKTEAVQSKPRQQTDVGIDKTSRSDSSWVDRSKDRRSTDGAQPRTQDQAEASSTDFIHVVSKKKKTKKSTPTLTCATRAVDHPSGASYTSATPTGAIPRTSAPSHHHHVPPHRRRTSSPPRRKSVCSAPHSDKSNDSSDVDSVHSLPAAGGERRRKGVAAPASYAAAIARGSAPERRRFADARVGRDSPGEGATGSPKTPTSSSWATQSDRSPATGTPVATANAQTQTSPPKQQPPPDVHNIKSFPAISKVAPPPSSAIKVASVATQKSPPQPARPVVQQQQPLQRVPAEGGARGVASNVPEPPQHQQQQQQHRDLKADLSIIQANEMETVQYNSQMMPNMEIPDVQTIEKLNYMNQPGAHMPPHLQHHVVPPQHLHMAMPPAVQQRSPVVNQPPPPPFHHVTYVDQARPFSPPTSMPDIYLPQPHYAGPQPTTVVAHHHHHHHHHPPHHAMAYPPQAYEGVAVAYVDPAYMTAQAQQHPQQQQMQVLSHHHHHQQQQQQPAPMQHPVMIAQQQQQQQDTPIRQKPDVKWAESDVRNRPKQHQLQQPPQPPQQQPQRRFDRNHAHPDRRRDAPRTLHNPNTPPYHHQQQHHHHHQQQHHQVPHHNQAVTLYRRDPVPRRGARSDPAPPPGPAPLRGGAAPISNCDSEATTNASDDGDAAPPVVIMSGAPRDVPGIEFGFAVNPDLVDSSGGDEEEAEEEEYEDVGEEEEEDDEEDDESEAVAAALGVCEAFEQYWRPPPASATENCNHDKVAHYLDSAWKDVVKSGKVKIYSPSKKDKSDSDKK